MESPAISQGHILRNIWKYLLTVGCYGNVSLFVITRHVLMNEWWILSIHSSHFSTLLCVFGASLEGTAAVDFFTIWQPILGLAKGRCQKKECAVGIYISSTPFLAGHCKLVVSFYQRPNLLVVSLLL